MKTCTECGWPTEACECEPAKPGSQQRAGCAVPLEQLKALLAEYQSKADAGRKSDNMSYLTAWYEGCANAYQVAVECLERHNDQALRPARSNEKDSR